MAAKKAKKKAKRVVAGESQLEALMDELLALKSEEVAPPVIPVHQLVAEALSLSRDATRHRDILEEKGCPPELIDALAVRGPALSESQSSLVNFRKRSRTKEDIALELLARELRGDMVADGRHATRGDTNAAKTLDEIMEGEGVADTVQDLRSLVPFFKKYRAQLTRIGVAVEDKMEHATDVANDLEASALSRTDAELERKAIDLRDRAASHLYAAMKEVRETGQYAFRKDPKLAELFRSEYVARKEALAKKKKKTGGGQ